jgi:hypothetical protein
MGRSVRTIGVLSAVVVVAAIVAYWVTFGTISPCGMLRESFRQRAGFATILPESVVDLAIAGQYGVLSPGRCMSILLEQRNAPAPAPQDDLLEAALQQTAQAGARCRAKRLSGELTTYAASALCSNPAMIQEFNAIHYKYMDLIEYFASKRLEFAAKIDRGELSEDQAKAETARVYETIQVTERQRDGR